MKTIWDVVVVGGGGSGLAAAVSAAEQGLQILLLEKQSNLGGTTGIAVGSFTACNTSMQQQAGIQDNASDHEQDAALFGPAEIQARNHHALRKYFLEHTAETLDWLRSLGLNFHGPNPEPPNRVPRMHNVVPNAKAYIAVLQSRLLRLGGQIVCEAEVTQLMQDSQRVTGVQVQRAGQSPITIQARHGVVLAAGDYANNAEMIAKYKGKQFAKIEGINPHAGGQGHKLVKDIGGELINMDVTYGPELRFVPPKRQAFTQLLPACGFGARLLGWCLPYIPASFINQMIKQLLVTWQHPEDALFDDGAILVNQLGKRFCEERLSPEREIAIAEQPDKLAYLLLDHQLINRYSKWPHFISTAPEIAYAYVEDYHRLRPDITTVANSLQEISTQRELPLEALTQSVAESELQDDFTSGPWALLGPVKSYFTTTEGGANINQQLQVLDPQGQPIAGCYAVGQNGLGGMILWGHGLHIAWAITSGRLAGLELARQAAQED